jgi:hypothetical protein
MLEQMGSRKGRLLQTGAPFQPREKPRAGKNR